MVKSMCVVLCVLSQTCMDALWNLFLLVPIILVKPFFHPLYWMRWPLFVGEVRGLNFESPKLNYLTQRIWLLDFIDLSPLFRKFVIKRIFISSSLLTSIRKFISFFRKFANKKTSLSNFLWNLIILFDFILQDLIF